jgi:hypothetical protein
MCAGWGVFANRLDGICGVTRFGMGVGAKGDRRDDAAGGADAVTTLGDVCVANRVDAIGGGPGVGRDDAVGVADAVNPPGDGWGSTGATRGVEPPGDVCV